MKFQLRDDDLAVDPAEIFRPKVWPKYLGYRHSQIHEKQKSGELPPPIPLSESGRAVAYTGAQLIEIHRRRLAAAKKRATERNQAAQAEIAKT
jgi:hypothetical protein